MIGALGGRDTQDRSARRAPELASAGAIYSYSFILTSLDVSSPDKAAAAKQRHRHRTTIENNAVLAGAIKESSGDDDDH